MVINFNLLLVWLPMCKYSLTRLAFLANNSLRCQRQHQQQIISGQDIDTDSSSHYRGKSTNFNCDPKKYSRLATKIKTSINEAMWRMKYSICSIKINSINSFLIAVDQCKSLHTICATTITIASVIHTVAHLVNVINFSKNFDPFLSNLNMADYKGQNPFQLLVSVPGITGCLMIMILILMSLSSVDFIRNSSYDLFLIFHRLSIVFVLLLFLHPVSHVLKEQSNIERHHPEICYRSELSQAENPSAELRTSSKMFDSELFQNSQRAPSSEQTDIGSTLALPLVIDDRSEFDRRNENIYHQGQSEQGAFYYHNDHANSNKTIDLKNSIERNHNNNNDHDIAKVSTSAAHSNRSQIRISKMEVVDNDMAARFRPEQISRETEVGNSNATKNAQQPKFNRSSDNRFCLDPKPLFVAQSSICLYVLSLGLSCYLLDLLLRKLRRSKSSIQLLNVHSDCEGNLIELILSSNHKRFTHWLPGQFIYLNCPQIATYEWHPFTISSMNNREGRFTLHIKTGGDWTRKLRETIESDHKNSKSLVHQRQLTSYDKVCNDSDNNIRNCHIKYPFKLDQHVALSNFDCYNGKTGQPEIECTKLVRLKDMDGYCNEGFETDHTTIDMEKGTQAIYSICQNYTSSQKDHFPRDDESHLDLFIDGPFHSPFERLLEQQVSVCIANGVGWTAFSSVFQCITDKLLHLDQKKCWWAKWQNFATTSKRNRHQSSIRPDFESHISGTHEEDCNKRNLKGTLKSRKLTNDTKLHLTVIVTSIEQLKPFYNLAINYFKRMRDEFKNNDVNEYSNPVREIVAFITRATNKDELVKEFCLQEDLPITNEDNCIRVNNVFTIYFGKPKFDNYLSAFKNIYPDSRKISVYCCGSYLVKKDVREICRDLNRKSDRSMSHFYSYHEENF